MSQFLALHNGRSAVLYRTELGSRVRAITGRSSAFAVLRLITNSNLVGNRIGRSRLLTLENAAGIHSGLAIHLYWTGSVAHEAACRRVLAPLIDRCHRIASRERNDLRASAGKERIRGYEEGTDSPLRECLKGSIDVAIGASA